MCLQPEPTSPACNLYGNRTTSVRFFLDSHGFPSSPGRNPNTFVRYEDCSLRLDVPKVSSPFGLIAVALSLTAQTPSPSLTLDQVLDEALNRNLRLLAERLNVSIGEARLIQARLKPNPVLSVGGNYLDVLGSGFDPRKSAAGPTEVNARLDYLLERGHKRQERIAVAEATRAVSQLELLNSTRTLILDVQNGFTEVLLAKENLALARASLEAFNRIVAVNRTRVDSGDLAKVELVRSEVAALQFRNQVRQSEMRLRIARNRLQALMGRTVFARDFDITGALRRDRLLLRQPEILQAALAARPDLDALRRDQARSQAEVRLQLAQGKVDYSIGAGYNRQWNVGAGQRGDSLGVFFSLPLPVYNRNQGEIERAKQEQSQIQARVRSLEQEIAAEVANAYEQYSTAQALLESIEADMLQQAGRVREVIDFSYRRGEATFVELLDAQRTFNETMQALNEARAEYARSLFLIDSIAGTTSRKGITK
ncbi:MAG: TolC family protein [Bryobacterales bacterium]|nr:TolC family protein [Bryobacterales bacterium]